MAGQELIDAARLQAEQDATTVAVPLHLVRDAATTTWAPSENLYQALAMPGSSSQFPAGAGSSLAGLESRFKMLDDIICSKD